MKAIIKKTHEIDGHWFKVSDEEGKVKHFHFEPTAIDDDFASEKNAFSRAMKLAKEIEAGLPVEEVVYETPDPENEKQTAGIDLSKIDEP